MKNIFERIQLERNRKRFERKARKEFEKALAHKKSKYK
jgi:hypothetical protein